MTDRDRFELEMSAEMEPPSGLGDRVLVGLAVVALVGGALIAVGNVLPDPEDVAQASAAQSSRASRTPRPSPTPEPPRVAALVEPDIEIVSQQPSLGFDGWIRALHDLAIRGRPVLDAPEIGVFEEGEISLVSSQEESLESGWLFLQERGGWILSTIDGVDVIRRYQYPRYRYSGWVQSVTAGPDGFVVILSQPGGPDVYEPSRPATSTDGASWRSADPSPFSSWGGVNGVASGPAGWLAAGFVRDDTRGRVLLWSSPDGLAWTRLGMLEGVHDEFVTQLLASDHGYLLETYSHGRGFSPSGTLWSSPDGLLWRESTDPLLGHLIEGERRIAALHDGFYLWDGYGNPTATSSFAAFSEDGLSWNEVEDGPDGANLQITQFEDRLVAIDLDRKTLAPRVWSGAVADRQVSWIRETASDAAFTGAVTRQLVSDGTGVFAFGEDLATDEGLVWTGDGLQWARESLPASFGGIPLIAAGGPNGAVVVGYRRSLRGDNPIFWHLSATGRWLPEADPILVAVPDPAGEDCPALPDEFLEYAVVDAAAIVSCHGATPITFRAYSVPCRECAGSMEGNPEPAWLLNPQSDQFWLSPDDTHADWTTTAVLDPSLVPLDPDWTRAWLEVTGHFDDPAAATCHREPVADEIAYWYGLQPLVDQCRMTFVVTEVKLISPP
jgi:hypothetical protein